MCNNDSFMRMLLKPSTSITFSKGWHYEITTEGNISTRKYIKYENIINPVFKSPEYTAM